jgi:N-ethylmaleimide reductase
MHDSDPLATFSYVVKALDAMQVGYIHLTEPNAKRLESGGVAIPNVAETFRPMTNVPLIINAGFNKAKGNAAIAAGHADLVGFGVAYIANPDLVERYRTDAALNMPNPTTFYGVGPGGYTDYPSLAA